MSRTTHPRPKPTPEQAHRLIAQRPPAEVVLSAAALAEGAARRRGLTRDLRDRLEELAAELVDVATELVAREGT